MTVEDLFEYIMDGLVDGTLNLSAKVMLGSTEPLDATTEEASRAEVELAGNVLLIS